MSDPIIITDKDELKKAINKDDYTSQKLFGDNTPDKQCIDPWHIKIDTTGVDCDKEKATKSAPEGVIKQLPKQDNISTDVQNLKGILTDIAAGDPEAFKRPEFQCLNFDAIYAAIDWLIKTDQLSDLAKADLAENGWRLNFRARPPTPEEFLTEKYIGDQANTLYAPVRKSFIEAMDPLSPTRTVILSPHIGWGKPTTLDTPVYVTKDTYKEAGELQLGDKILSPDGNQTVVDGIEDWKDLDVYELEMEDGTKIHLGLHHLNHVSYRKDDKGNPIWEEVETEFILNHPEIEFAFEEMEVNENPTHVATEDL